MMEVSKVYKPKSFPMDFPFSIKFTDMEPFYCMNHTFHWHNYLEIAFVKKGKGIYYVENRTYEMNEGDIVVINNIEPHYMEVLPPVNMVMPVVMFEPQLVWSSESLFDYNYMEPFFERSSNFNNKIDSKSEIGRKIFAMLSEIEDEYVNKTVGYKLMIKAKLLHIITYLIRHYQDSSKSTESITSKSKRLEKLEKVFDYINGNYSQKIELHTLAELAYMSPNYFSTFFKQSTGFTPIEYLNKMRISKSIEMLRETDFSVAQIAMDCGFNNLANYNKIFKQLTETTPTRIRNGK
ncbi:AraC family transcriptional regulator [Ruminiclostridium cellobioparum]|uniref:AraC family transcriptional regulator n=1 Tax=Ruminiclostridium cellobioparum TaxID=29355 RepID=UPI0004857C02|nr:AraC family transcriptional regulator [Ruminiclostridium cellobioparum]